MTIQNFNTDKTNRSSMETGIVRLSCKVQNYAWGKLGQQSQVARLSGQADCSKPEIDDGKPYAELWMGTHPNAPSVLYNEPLASLSSLVSSDPKHFLGDQVARKFEGNFPFLFKVLSVNKALSIQAHPDLELARKLHAERPEIYKDPNHKPEMAVALTPFEALCGFRPLEEIVINLEKFPEFCKLIGESLCKEFIDYTREFNIKRRASSGGSDTASEANDSNDKAVLKKVFEALMRADSMLVSSQLQALVSRLDKMDAKLKQVGSIEELVLRLNNQFPDDVGCFCAFLLNFVRLEPMESLFLAANEPHAYLSGDCVECMAASDNVVRAGLTPKLKDVETLVSMLTYKSYGFDEIIMKPQLKTEKHVRYYDAPIPEFSIRMASISPSQDVELSSVNGPQIIIVTKGNGTMETVGSEGSESVMFELTEGAVFFVAANQSPLKLYCQKSEPTLTVFNAFCSI